MILLRNLTNNLGYVIIIAFIISNLPIFKRIIQKDSLTLVEQLTLSFIFGAFGIVSTYIGTSVNGAIANTRIIGITVGGILFGPFVGIFSGIIAGFHRFLYDLGGVTSIPCAITTVLSGFAAAFIYRKCSSTSKWVCGLICGIIIESIEMLLILLISRPFYNALAIVKSIYFPMGLTNAIGIALLITLIQRAFNEKEEIAAKQAQLALEIANKTLPYCRDLTSDSFEKISEIIKTSTGAAAVSITDKHTILSHVGLGSDHHIKGEKLLTNATKLAISTGEIQILNSPADICCVKSNCKLRSAIVAPLKDGDEVIGTLKIYYSKPNGISFRDRTLAIGLSQLISTQLEIGKVGKLKELATKAEMKALQAQINPHFLFNALNTIVSFLRFDPNRAREIIINLSTYLRYNIDEINAFVDISKELEQVKAYVEVEKARFGSKLKVEYNIDVVHVKIPSLTIQPIVENSIKHGILKGSGNGTVKIDVKKLSEDDVLISIEDDGVGIPQWVIDNVNSGTMKENKIGISNVNNRLKYIYGSGLEIKRLDKGTCTSFKVHKMKED